jgi:hypothetical protein
MSLERRWLARTAGHADPDGPPATTSITVKGGAGFTLPKASIVVVRRKLIGTRDYLRESLLSRSAAMRLTRD